MRSLSSRSSDSPSGSAVGPKGAIGAPERATRFGRSLLLAALGTALGGAAFSSPASGVRAFSDDGDAPASAPTAKPLVLSAKRVIIRPGKVIENAKVLIIGDEIIAVGTDIDVPKDATVLEGEVVCAAFHDAWSIVGVDGPSASATNSNSAARAIDAIDPVGQAQILQELVEAGVLLARTQIGAGSTYGGIGVVIRAHEAEPLLCDASLSARLGITRGGSNFVQRVGRDGRVTFEMVPARLDPVDRIRQIDKLINDLQAGQKYAQDHAKYDRDLAEWKEAIAETEKELEGDFKKAKKARDKKVKAAEGKGDEHKDKKYKEDKRPRAPKYDAQKAAFARAVEGELPFVVHAERAVEIRELLRLTKPFTRLRLVIAGGTGALACTAELAERGVPVIVAPRPSDRGGPIGELDPGLALASELDARGVEVLIGSGATSARASRDLAHLAALAVGNGLDRDVALRAITLGPARVFDVAGEVGSVQRGRRADLLLLSGDPLSSSTRVLAAISAGEVVHQAGD